MTKRGSSLAPVPSAELRGAIDSFRAALGEAVRLVQARKKVFDVNDQDIIVALDLEGSEMKPVLHNNCKGDEDTVADETGESRDDEGDVVVEGEKDEWTLVR